jgi:hypothetical protein
VIDFLASLFSSGLGVDIALGFIGLEFVILFLQAQRGQRVQAAINLMLALGPGVCLMIALRCALTQAGFGWIGFWLTASLPLHLSDIARRKF